MQVAVFVPGNVEVCNLGEILVEAVAQANAALYELAAEDGRAFALVPQNLDDDGTADFPRKGYESAGLAVFSHLDGDCNCSCNCDRNYDFGVICLQRNYYIESSRTGE